MCMEGRRLALRLSQLLWIIKHAFPELLALATASSDCVLLLNYSILTPVAYMLYGVGFCDIADL